MSKLKLLMLDEPSLGLEPKLVLSKFKYNKANQRRYYSLARGTGCPTSIRARDMGYVLETDRVTLKAEGKEL